MIADKRQCVLVYDIGGSHVTAALCFEGDCRLGPTFTEGHPEQQACDAFVGVLHSLGVNAATGANNVQGAELAMPGPFDYAAGVSWMKHKLPYLYGLDLRQTLADRFGWKSDQVRFLNDAAAYLLGEVGAGAAREVPRAVGITLGTGIGSAFAVNGRIVTEGPGVPPGGEIWNLPYNGRTVEDFVSTRAIHKTYRERTGQEREVADIAAGADHDAAAVEAFAEFGRHLGRALRILLTDFAPDVVVLGGGIARSASLFLSAAQLELQGLNLELRISALGDHAPLVGAGVAWFSKAPSSAPGQSTTPMQPS